MAVNIRPPQPAGQPAMASPAQAFRDFIQHRVDGYCSEANHKVLVQHGISEFALESVTAQITLDLELERLLVTNEKKLVKELIEALQRFTVSDKKLDKKEEADAIQMVCKAMPGYRYGLNHDLAQNAVNDFCRANGVKKKTGLFSWAIP
jgi:hypothetical protein